MRTRHKLFRLIRKVHLWVGLFSALYFMLIAATGVAMNHREGLHLDEHYIGRQWLPSSYRPNDGIEVRSDIVVTDLHSGLIFGKVGAPVLDLVALVWFTSIISGISMFVLGKSIHGRAADSIPPEPEKKPAESIAGVSSEQELDSVPR